MNIKRKIKEKNGGSGIIIVMAVILVVFCGIFPSILDSINMNLKSERLKADAYRASNSASTLMMTYNNVNNNVDFNYLDTMAKIKTYYSTLYNENYTALPILSRTIPNNPSKQVYYQTFVNNDNTHAFEVILFQDGETTTSILKSLISTSISQNSNSESVDVSKVVADVDIKKPTAVVIFRDDVQSYMFHKKETLVRFAASQVNYINPN